MRLVPLKPAPPLALAGALALTAPALSQQFDRSALPEDTRWVAHIDIQALQRSVLFQEAKKAAGEDFEEGLDLDELREEFGVDPLQDFKSVTVFGSTTREEQAVVMVRATAKVDAILERFRQEEAYRSFEVDGYRVHSWDTGGDEQPGAYIHTPSGSEDRIVVISNDQAMLLRSARVIAGQARSLAETPNAALTTQPSASAFLFVDVAESLSKWGDFEPVSKIAGLMRSFTLEAGEERGRAYLTARLETQRGQDATRIADIVNGFRSLIPLIAHEEVPAFVTELLDGLQVTANGTFVSLQLAYDSRQLVEELKELEHH